MLAGPVCRANPTRHPWVQSSNSRRVWRPSAWLPWRLPRGSARVPRRIPRLPRRPAAAAAVPRHAAAPGHVPIRPGHGTPKRDDAAPTWHGPSGHPRNAPTHDGPIRIRRVPTPAGHARPAKWEPWAVCWTERVPRPEWLSRRVPSAAWWFPRTGWVPRAAAVARISGALKQQHCWGVQGSIPTGDPRRASTRHQPSRP